MIFGHAPVRRNHLIWLVALVLVAVVAAVVTVVVLSSSGGGGGGGQPPAPGRGSFATILFSRTELTQADDCVANDTGVARLDTTVAPFLKSLGIRATGSLQTAAVTQSGEACTHYRSSLMASWDQADSLAKNYGWSFISHTAHYPNSPNLTPAQAEAETCGSAATIDAHGLPGGHGMIAYPGVWKLPTRIQTDYGAKCFAWGRWYGNDGITPSSAGRTAPYFQHTLGAEGGPCQDSTQPCYRLSMVSGSNHYTQPSALIADVGRLQPDEWLTLQQFVLVQGKSPTYTTSRVAWDCTSANPELHWTNDNERYCYNDWQQVIRALVARRGITFTDPLSVGVAFGRPGTYSP